MWKNVGNIGERIKRVRVSEPRLGIDGKGELGRIGSCLRVGSNMVTYSHSSPKQLTNVLLYNEINVKGVDFYKYIETHRDSIQQMMEILVLLMEDNKLVGQVKSIECLNDFCVAYNDKVTQDVCGVWVCPEVVDV